MIEAFFQSLELAQKLKNMSPEERLEAGEVAALEVVMPVTVVGVTVADTEYVHGLARSFLATSMSCHMANIGYDPPNDDSSLHGHLDEMLDTLVAKVLEIYQREYHTVLVKS